MRAHEPTMRILTLSKPIHASLSARLQICKVGELRLNDLYAGEEVAAKLCSYIGSRGYRGDRPDQDQVAASKLEHLDGHA
jgi:hypothetical protein